MQEKTEKTGKKLSFHGSASTNKFVGGLYRDINGRLAADEPRAAAAEQIHNAFTTYLGHLKQNFPTIVIDEKDPSKAKEIDPRILSYHVLMRFLDKNDANLPVAYQGRELKFDVYGWPVAVDDESFVQWGIFTQAAATAYQTVLPDADLSKWAGPLQSNLDDIDSAQGEEELSTVMPPLFGDGLRFEPQWQESSSLSPAPSSEDTQELSTDTSLPSKELAPEQEPKESISSDSTSSNLQAQPQSAPQELDNYDFDAWQAPAELTRLRASIKAMHTYGLGLKTTCPKKADAAMQLAVELTKDLQNYYANAAEARNEEAFKKAFHQKLHSHDELMSTHRNYAKVVLANIAIALTGIGLAVIVVSLLVRGHGLYNATQGQNKVNDIDLQFDKSLRAI
ncbi:hypothetical protein ACD661_13885 [Legionella lytica]|uniref:Effector protein B, substrate of the Dot/Icm secretion system n=1 Tax=Legionella lytica TaxID=96232 RepID=A0ABW8DDS0_9GAMM